MNKFAAQRRLSILWFINAGVIALIFIFFTIVSRFGDKASDGWQWYSQTVIPTLTLMIGTFTASVSQTKSNLEIDRFYFRLAYYVSIFYFIVLYATILSAPLAFNLTETSLVELLNNSKIYLNIIQGVVTFSLGLFFTKNTNKKGSSLKS